MKKEKRCIKFPSIEQFKNVVANINRHYDFIGLDGNGEAIYDHSKPKPILSFIGTCKLHGTNAGVSFNNIDGLWFQSRENIITPEHDNAGFAFNCEANREIWLKLIEQVKEENSIDLDNNTITIYSEWVGKGIQKGVGITNLDKSSFIFGVKISPFEFENLEKQKPAYWVNHLNLRSPENRIYNINDYKTFSITVDFNTPQLVINKMIEDTISVEDECPVSLAFGYPNTIGEGIVYSLDFEGIRYYWKSKGEKHAGKSKVKTLNQVDDEKIKKLLELADRVTPEFRLDQMLTQSCDLLNGGTIENKKLGDFIRMVVNDVVKEELLTLAQVGVEPKEINKYISDISRRYFFERQNKEIGLI